MLAISRRFPLLKISSAYSKSQGFSYPIVVPCFSLQFQNRYLASPSFCWYSTTRIFEFKIFFFAGKEDVWATLLKDSVVWEVHKGTLPCMALDRTDFSIVQRCRQDSTLAFAYRKLELSEYSAWNDKFAKAKTSIGGDRDVMLEQLSDVDRKRFDPRWCNCR
ncbi:hypothetical protein L6452_28057 [Arctium lappa]|uniref:Uncharacterized protein n=1 Tax=Arctium lappa TaxID=4217 RepID=A0ACB8ZXN6_ARCLA|nr:hypothetical protein L6452_28057 [Arctium lappa]